MIHFYDKRASSTPEAFFQPKSSRKPLRQPKSPERPKWRNRHKLDPCTWSAKLPEAEDTATYAWSTSGRNGISISLLSRLAEIPKSSTLQVTAYSIATCHSLGTPRAIGVAIDRFDSNAAGLILEC